MKMLIFSLLLLCFFGQTGVLAQEVNIQSSSVDSYANIQIKVNSSSEYYYLLHCKPELNGNLEWIVSISEGEDGTTTITESLKAYPIEHYRVTQHSRSQPDDADNDGKDDIAELNDLGKLGPLNPAPAINENDGVVCIPNRETFEELSYKGTDVMVDSHLKELEYVKFYILNASSSNRQVYFMNTITHRAHGSFAKAIGISSGAGGGGGGVSGSMRGEIVYHPSVMAPNGRLGVYRFEFEPNDSWPFEDIQMAYELLAANMPFLKNNWTYYPMPNAALPKYNQEKDLYDNSRIAVLLDEDIFAEIDYMALNIAEGYGLLKVMELDETPNSRDIVIFEALPNELSRVGGIITTVTQTPLSHVNLRAIQDNVPNAYIANALENDNITDLIGKYVYYKVEASGYSIREATLAEVEAYYEDLRPSETQYPVRDLSVTKITPLDDVNFEDSKSFGVKAANLATMRNFGFPDGTIPNGFAVPFYFYDEFMKYNNFYNDVEEMLSNDNFLNNYDVQEEMLDDLRDEIKDADMPGWMLDELDDMHKSFPEGTSIRCRSSTNNEDLPGFSGAGLYDSKTQHPDEGHMSKSIKQVFASLWNFRAFDERQFYRIDHFTAAMGVLCHPNFSDELANGVGVSTDPIYGTEDTYYLNTQLGEDLVTNPEALSIPEELLLDAIPGTDPGYSIIRPSNLVEDGEQLMSEQHLDEMREYLGVIHDEFQILYDAVNQSNFAMEIEYKITSENVLVIKQARPWVVVDVDDELTSIVDNSIKETGLQNYPNPFSSTTIISFSLEEQSEVLLEVYNSMGQRIQTLLASSLSQGQHTVNWIGTDSNGNSLNNGLYLCRLVIDGTAGKAKQMILSK